jgi:hypothetical protein
MEGYEGEDRGGAATLLVFGMSRFKSRTGERQMGLNFIVVFLISPGKWQDST